VTSAVRAIFPAMKLSTAAGLGLVVLGVGMNIPFAVLGATFDYPDILRRPTADVLVRFQAGGPALIATWYAFAAAALGLGPVAIIVHDVLAPGDGRRGSSGLRLATLAGLGAGLVQAMGLVRWVFVVPVLARTYANSAADEATRAAAVVAFESLHQFAGVALGEHLGQMGTAVWAALVARELRQRGGFPRWTAWVGFGGAGLITLGLVEGFATVVAFDPGLLGLATPVGYIALSVWMVAVGVNFIRRPVDADPRAPRGIVGVSGPSNV
jgi:hypothetical protein